MLTLIFFGAALVCLIAAPFCRSGPTEQEVEDDQRLKSFWLFPGIVVAMIAVFFKARGLEASAPRQSAFALLVCLSLGFIVAGILVMGLAPSGTHR
jgi:hypothetical protein